MVLAVPFICQHAPAEPIGGADRFDEVVVALADLGGDAQLLDEILRVDIGRRAVDPNPLEPKPSRGLWRKSPRDGAGACLAGVAIADGIAPDPISCFTRCGVFSDIVHARAAEESTGVLAEDPGAKIVEGGRFTHREHLLADVFGGGFDGEMVDLAPRHPGEQVPVA